MNNQVLRLKKPITINGTNVNSVEYNTDEITAQQFAEADSRKMRASGSKGGNLSGAVELDYGLHLYLGFAAIIAVNPSYDIVDLERIKGPDVMGVMKIGRNFTLGSVAKSTAGDSEEPSETMQEPSIPQSQT